MLILAFAFCFIYIVLFNSAWLPLCFYGALFYLLPLKFFLFVSVLLL